MVMITDYRWIILIYCKSLIQYFSLYLDAKGLGSMNQAQKDCHIDNNSKFAIYSLQLYAIVTMTLCKSINT